MKKKAIQWCQFSITLLFDTIPHPKDTQGHADILLSQRRLNSFYKRSHLVDVAGEMQGGFTDNV
jgi:hypothetical protein